MNLKGGYPFAVPLYQQPRYIPYAVPTAGVSAASAQPYAIMVPQATVGPPYYLPTATPAASPYLAAAPANHLTLATFPQHALPGTLGGVAAGALFQASAEQATSPSSTDEAALHTISRKPVMYNASGSTIIPTTPTSRSTSSASTMPSVSSSLNVNQVHQQMPSIVQSQSFLQPPTNSQDYNTSDYHSDASANNSDLLSEPDTSGRISQTPADTVTTVSTSVGLVMTSTNSTNLSQNISHSTPERADTELSEKTAENPPEGVNEQYAVETPTECLLPDPGVIVPKGWKRLVEEDSVVYISPTGVQLVSHDNIRDYLTRVSDSDATGSCTCGLDLDPADVPATFDFDHQRNSLPLSGNDVDTSIGCNMDTCPFRRKSNLQDIKSITDVKDEPDESTTCTRTAASESSSCTKRPADSIDDTLTDEANKDSDSVVEKKRARAEDCLDEEQALHDYLTAEEAAMVREAAAARSQAEESVDMEISGDLSSAAGTEKSPTNINSPESRVVVEAQGVTWVTAPTSETVPSMSMSMATNLIPTAEATQMSWINAPAANMSPSTYPFVTYYNPYGAAASPYFPWMDYNAAAMYAPSPANFVIPAQYASAQYVAAVQQQMVQAQAQAVAVAQAQAQVQAHMQAQAAAAAAATTGTATATSTRDDTPAVDADSQVVTSTPSLEAASETGTTSAIIAQSETQNMALVAEFPHTNSSSGETDSKTVLE